MNPMMSVPQMGSMAASPSRMYTGMSPFPGGPMPIGAGVSQQSIAMGGRQQSFAMGMGGGGGLNYKPY